MSLTPDQLERENRYVLSAVQALLGLIDRRVEAVAIQVGFPEIVLRFWVAGDASAIAEDADDVVADMEAFLIPEEDAPITVELLPAPVPPDVYEWAGRMVYRKKRDQRVYDEGLKDE